MNTSSGTTVRSNTSHIQTVARQDSLSLSAESALLVKKTNTHLTHWKLMTAKHYDPEHTQHMLTSYVRLPLHLSDQQATQHMYKSDSPIVTTVNPSQSPQPPLLFTTIPTVERGGGRGGEAQSSVRNKMIFVEGVKKGMCIVLHILGEILLHQYDAYM